jgi:hypothetical protein
MEIWIRI